MDEREVSEDQCRAVELGTVVFAKDDLSVSFELSTTYDIPFLC